MEPRYVEDSFQTINLKTLRSKILESSNVPDLPKASSGSAHEGYISCFTGASTFKHQPFFPKYPDALQIHLFVGLKLLMHWTATHRCINGGTLYDDTEFPL